jgi:signal transduction histidine kinase
VTLEVRAPSPRVVRLIAFGRLMLMAPIVFWLLFTPPDLTDPFARVLIAVYTVHALVLLLLLQRRRPAYRIANFPLTLHLIDLGFATALLYTTSGADSPFFGPLVFATVSATLQWGFRGAVLTGLAVVLAYLPSGIAVVVGLDGGREALMQFSVRLGYTGAIVVLLGALARHFERIVAELGSLSSAFQPLGDDPDPPVRDLLRHAMSVFQVDRAALVWRAPGDPSARLAIQRNHDDPTIQKLELAPATPLVAAGDAPALLYERYAGSFVRADKRVSAGPPHPFAEPLYAALNFDRALALRAACDGIDGWVIVLDHRDAAIEDLAIGAMVSAQISLALDRWRNQQLRHAIIAGEERIRLGRDLHDGVVQFLAGVGFQLDTLAQEPLSDRGRETVRMLRHALSQEQRDVRDLIQRPRPAANAPEEALALDSELRDLGEQLSGYWGVRVAARVTPPRAEIPARLAADLGFLVREGVANAVRHGHATTVELLARAEEDRLALEIDDNGRGFGFEGSLDDAELQGSRSGPRSLFERTRELGGKLSLVSSPRGAHIALCIPLAGAH